MTQFNFNKLDHTTQGIILLILGIVLLLYTLNIFTKWFNMILILCSLAMIVVGGMKLGLIERTKELLNKKK